MEMARCLASGSNFLDRVEFKTQKAKVLYIERETYGGTVQTRGRQLGLEKLGSNLYHLKEPFSLSLNDERMSSYLETVVRENKINVVFIDTFRSVAGGLQEEKADEIRKFFNRFASLKESGRTFVFLDHCRKQSRLDGYAPKKEWLFGSQDKAAACEQLIMQRSKEGSREISVWIRKSKGGVERKPFKIFIDDTIVAGVVKTKFSFGGEIADKKEKSEEAKELIKNYLSEEGAQKTAAEIKTALSEKNIGANAVDTALREMRENKEIPFRKVGPKKILYGPLEKNEDSQ